MLVGVWAPKRWDLSLPAVAQYTVPRVPPENPWVDRSKSKSKSRPATPSTSATSLASSPSAPATPAPASAPASPATQSPAGKRRRPPSRRLIRHVLRARVEAAKALASLFAQLERAPDGKRVCAAVHLARAFGGSVDAPDVSDPAHSTESGVEAVAEPQGWRGAREVVAFLRARGAKITTLERRVEGDWAALSSDGEGSESEGVSFSEKDDTVWVPSGQH